MSEKKHIDRIFQENFKDFEATPSDAVWANIEAKLNNKKKKRRIIPIWWRYAGIAALLLLFLSIGGVYYNSTETSTKNQIVDSEDSKIENANQYNQDISNPFNETKNNSIASDADIIITNDKSSLIQKKQPVIANSKSTFKTLGSKNGNPINSSTQKTNVFKESFASKNSLEKNNAAIASNIEQNNVGITSEHIWSDQDKQKQFEEETSKNSLAIVETKTDIKKHILENDFNSNALTIEEAIDKNKAVVIDEKPDNRWSIAPNIAPVYFNTLNEGSSIDREFNTNSKTGDVNMSFGLSTSYAINKKFKVRSGINKVSLGYNTNDVVVFQSSGTSKSALSNVNKASSNLNVSSDASIVNSSSSNSVVSTNSSINQSFGYIEVPLEIQYTFIDKKLGVNFIGGFSSFFLDNNEIYSEGDNGTRTYLGEANNINDISYSANLGLGLNYKFSKTIDLNLEPTFKYQFNTFSNTSGDFTPFFIGVYTGFAIKF